MLLLLVVALLHGRKYFHAGRTMYIGEHLVEQQQYDKALPYLQETLRIAPESDKAVLLTAKAALAVGAIDVADKAIQGHSGGKFEDANNDDFQQVKQTWDRAMKAADKAQQASKLAEQDGHSAEAARLMHEAAELYPEARTLAPAAEAYDAAAAFEAKDYDKFLELEQKQWQEHPLAITAGAVASALACKYAVTGDPKYRKQAEDMLELSRQKVGADPEELKSFEEYAERTRYRLTSRQIISRTEYDQKFRNTKKQ